MNRPEPPINVDNWTSQVRKGVLELCVLNALSHGEVYAYDLVKRLTKVDGIVVTEGTVYPLLSRMRKGGMVTSRLEESASGPARRYYAISPEGERIRDRMNAYWAQLISGVAALRDNKEANHG